MSIRLLMAADTGLMAVGVYLGSTLLKDLPELC